MLNGTLNGTSTNGHSRILGADGQPLNSSQAWEKRTQEYGEFAVPHVVTFSSLLGRAWRTYRINRADEAMKHGREEALAMKRDAYLQGLLQERKLAVANRPWRIEVDNERDPRQKQVKEGITRVIKDTWRLNRLRYYLHEGIWYGRYGSQLVYEFADIPLPNPSGGGHPYKQRALRVKMHQPVNGDKIDFKWDGTPLMLVHGSEGTQLPGTRTVITDKGRAVLLEGNLRQRFIVHSHEAVDADFFDADSASAVWGIGIRSTLFWLNWLRQEWLANIADWCERTGLGLRLWYYQGGNDKSKTAVTEAARAQSDKTNILIPRFATGGGQALEGVDYVDTASAGADLLLRLQQHVEEHIERYVIGQTLSSSSEGNGLGGTGVAGLHADTKSNITKFDAGNETDTMTADLVPILTQHTYPWCDFPVRYVVDVDDSNKKERMDAVRTAFVELGVDFVEDHVRALTGMDAPQEGERTLRQAQAEMQAMQPKPAMGPGMPQEGQEEGAPEEEKEEKPQERPKQEPPGPTQPRASNVGHYSADPEFNKKHPRDDAGRFKEKLSSMAHGDLRRVGGWLVRRLDDDKYRIDTDEGHVIGGAEKIERHIDRHKAKARLEGKAYTAAVKRGESAGDAPDILVDAERAKSEAERFHGLPHGTRVVSLADDTWGRLGTVERDKKAGRNRVKLDGEPGYVSEWVEPLEEGLSWRGEKGEAKKETPKGKEAWKMEDKEYLTEVFNRMKKKLESGETIGIPSMLKPRLVADPSMIKQGADGHILVYEGMRKGKPYFAQISGTGEFESVVAGVGMMPPLARMQKRLDEGLTKFEEREERVWPDPHEMTAEEYKKDDTSYEIYKDATGKDEFDEETAKAIIGSLPKDVEHDVVGYKGGRYKIGKKPLFTISTRPTHEKAVRNAIEAGKTVPDDVLAGYPDLAAKHKKADAKPAPLTISDLRDDPKPARASLFAELEQEVQRDLFGGDEPKVRQATLFQRQGEVGRYDFDERKHPRGQPENAGQFGPGGGAASDPEVIGKGSTGEVHRIGNKVHKTATKKEADAYALLNGKTGIAPGTVENGKIVTPFYKNVVSVDAIPRERRKSLGPVVAKAMPEIVSAITAMSRAGLDYNDPLQFGFDENRKASLFDFSMVHKTTPEMAIDENLGRLSAFLNAFGVERQAAAISHVNEVFRTMQDVDNELMQDEPETADAKKLLENLNGAKPENLYYATNGRTIPSVPQTEHRNGVKVIATAEPLSDAFMQQWEISPVIHSTNAEPGRYGREAKDEGAGRWITIGAEEGEDGKRHGGSPVYIENGRITKGAPSLVGRHIDSLEVPEEAPPELKGTKRQQAGQKAAKTRTENEREAGYQRAVWGKKARKEGIEPKHLHQLAADLLAHHGELSKDRAAMLKEARSALDEFGSKHRTITMSRGKGGKGEIGDATEIPGIDQVAEWAAGKYPHLFASGSGADDQLFGMLSGDDGSGADGKEGWSEADAYEQAFDHLMEAKTNPQAVGGDWLDDWEEPTVRGSTVEDDAVPFARTARPQFAPANDELLRYAREVEALRAQVATLTQPAKKRKRVFERDKAGRIVGITEIEG